MKLNKILNNLKEEFVTSLKYGGGYREIFVNPSRKEIMDILDSGEGRRGDDIRFIAVKGEKEVYVASADFLHTFIAKKGMYDNSIFAIIGNFSGMGRVEGDEIVVTEISDEYKNDDESYTEMIYDVLEGEYDWMEKRRYGNFNLDKIKKRFERKKEDIELGLL